MISNPWSVRQAVSKEKKPIPGFANCLIKRLVKAGLGFFSFETARRTLQAYEAMNMIRKGQIHGVEKRDIKCQVAFIANLFGVGVEAEQEGDFHPRCVSSLFLQHSRFLFVRDSETNITRIRGDAYVQERADTRSTKSKQFLSGNVHRQTLWCRSLS
jgi:hypothetical protein